MKTIVLQTLGAAWAASLSLAAALPPPPTGYKLEQDPMGDMLKSSHTGEQITATKVNDKWPGCAGDASIHLQYGWENMDGAAAFVDLMAKGPEDPAGLLGQGDAPAGKKLHLGGLLTWRKITGRAVGCAQSNLVTFNGTWIGASGGKLISVSVTHMLTSPDPAQALIDDYVGKVRAALGVAK